MNGKFEVQNYPLKATESKESMCRVNAISGGSSISERGAPTEMGGVNILFGQFFPKTAWKWRNFGMGASLVPSRSANGYCWSPHKRLSNGWIGLDKNVVKNLHNTGTCADLWHCRGVLQKHMYFLTLWRLRRQNQLQPPLVLIIPISLASWQRWLFIDTDAHCQWA